MARQSSRPRGFPPARTRWIGSRAHESAPPEDRPMIYTVAAGLAFLLSFVAFGLIAAWHVVPWLRTLARAEALVALIWVQAFRHVALQIFSAQKFGFAVSDAVRDE